MNAGARLARLERAAEELGKGKAERPRFTVCYADEDAGDAGPRVLEFVVDYEGGRDDER